MDINEDTHASILTSSSYQILLDEKNNYTVLYNVSNNDGSKVTINFPLVSKNIASLEVSSAVNSTSLQKDLSSNLDNKQSEDLHKKSGNNDEEDILQASFVEETVFSPLNDSWNEALAQCQTQDVSMEVVHSSQEYTDLSQSSVAGTEELSYPHVPFSVEELSLVNNLYMWSNRNVRVVGKITRSENGSIWDLESLGEGGGPYHIGVDVSLLQKEPIEGRKVQVFGELKSSPSVFILAKFFRSFEVVDIYHYNLALDEFQKRIPHFLNRSRCPMK